MPIVTFTGRAVARRAAGGRGYDVSIATPPWYDKMIESMAGKLEAHAKKKGVEAEVEVSISWHYRKRTFDQLKMFQVLIDKAAAVSGADRDDLYEAYLEDYGPRTEALLEPDAVPAFLEKFHRVIAREARGEWVYIKAIVGASQWNIKQASSAIDYWLNELAELGVDSDSTAAELAHLWRQWRLAMASDGIELIGPDEDIAPDEYKLRTPLCEACGTWIGAGGDLAHIKARGMGGNEAGIKLRPADWLHLCNKCHRAIQHQKGFGALLEKSPWLRNKVVAALTGGGL